jgi:hypothetical protein
MASQTMPVMEAFEAAYGRLLDQHPEDELGRMLHRPGIRTTSGFYGFVTKGDLVVKLAVSRVDELIADGEGQPCSPRPGHPMRQWVRLRPADEATCLAYLVEARGFVTSS